MLIVSRKMVEFNPMTANSFGAYLAKNSNNFSPNGLFEPDSDAVVNRLASSSFPSFDFNIIDFSVWIAPLIEFTFCDVSPMRVVMRLYT